MKSSHQNTLSAQSLLQSSPSHSGRVEKLHTSLVWTFLPLVIQKILLRMNDQCCLRYFTFGLCPTFKKRFLCLIGSYLYKYKDESSQSPKGSPLNLMDIQEVKFVSFNLNNNAIRSEDGFRLNSSHAPYDSLIVIRTLRKNQYFMTENEEEAIAWVNAIRAAREELIKRSMNHSQMPYPQNLRNLDELASALQQKKARIRKKLERMENREMEMSAFLNQGFHTPKYCID